jgi:hypothetical protein
MMTLAFLSKISTQTVNTHMAATYKYTIEVLDRLHRISAIIPTKDIRGSGSVVEYWGDRRSKLHGVTFCVTCDESLSYMYVHGKPGILTFGRDGKVVDLSRISEDAKFVMPIGSNASIRDVQFMQSSNLNDVSELIARELFGKPYQKMLRATGHTARPGRPSRPGFLADQTIGRAIIISKDSWNLSTMFSDHFIWRSTSMSAGHEFIIKIAAVELMMRPATLNSYKFQMFDFDFDLDKLDPSRLSPHTLNLGSSKNIEGILISPPLVWPDLMNIQSDKQKNLDGGSRFIEASTDAVELVEFDLPVIYEFDAAKQSYVSRNRANVALDEAFRYIDIVLNRSYNQLAIRRLRRHNNAGSRQDINTEMECLYAIELDNDLWVLHLSGRDSVNCMARLLHTKSETLKPETLKSETRNPKLET